MSLSRELLAEERISAVEHFLSPKECQGLIAACDKLGWHQSPPSGGGHGRTGREDARTSKFAILTDDKLANSWFQRLQPLLTPNLEWLEKSVYFGDAGTEFIEARVAGAEFLAGGVEWVPVGLVDRLRFYKYEKGDEYPDHYDGSYRRTVKRWKDNKKEELETFQQQTFLTLLVYLNEGMKGGETVYFYDRQHCRFLRDAIEKKVEVSSTPLTGKALITIHDQVHASLPIIAGEKYVMRTDIIFERKLKGHAKLLKDGDEKPSVGEWEKLFEPSCKEYHN